MALAAIDFGFKRLGVAISDAAGIGAYPLFTIARTSFAADLVKRELKLETAMFDERLTSFEARERIKAAKPSRSGRNRPIDAHAAAVILESYMASAGRGDEQPE